MFDHLRSIISSDPSTVRTFSTKPTESIGSGAGEAAYDQYTRTMNWITDTKKKLPNGGTWDVSPAMREEAYEADPLTSGIITPFLKNVILADYLIETKDNTKYTELINDIQEFINKLELMNAFSDDFEDYAIKHGHSYRRKDYDGEIVSRLQRLEPRAMRVYEDIWDSSIVAYHQQIDATNQWTDDGMTTEYNSWFIPEGKKYIPGVIAEPGALKIWNECF